MKICGLDHNCIDVRHFKDIHDCEVEYDYEDLLNMVQWHTCCTSYCLRKKYKESDMKWRFRFPLDHCPQTKLE